MLAHVNDRARFLGQTGLERVSPYRDPPAQLRAAQLTAHALATGFSRGFLTAAGIALLALLIAIVTIRVGRQESTGAVLAPQEATPQPATVQQHEDQAALAAAVRPCRLC